MSDEDQQALTSAIEQVYASYQAGDGRRANGLTAAAIHRALRAEGYKVSEDSVTRHTYRRCACFD